jgi:hypothetical protein
VDRLAEALARTWGGGQENRSQVAAALVLAPTATAGGTFPLKAATWVLSSTAGGTYLLLCIVENPQ